MGVGDAAFQGNAWDTNYFNLGISDDERSFRVSWSVVQSSEGVLTDVMRPRADGAITIEADGSGWGSYYQGDCFPSIEFVRERAGAREVLGRIRERGASAMIDTVSNTRHVFGEYC